MRHASELAVDDLLPDEFPRTCLLLNEGVEQGVAPGMVAGFWSTREPERLRLRAVGVRRQDSRLDANQNPSRKNNPILAQPMTVDTIFDLASVSKVFGTATLAAVFVERGWLSWETPVCAILPEFRHREVRLSHLLAHTSGLPAWAPLYEEFRAHFSSRNIAEIPISVRQAFMRERIFEIPLERPVEERAVYSDIGFIVLGYVLEQIAGTALDRAVRSLLWNPMGLVSASYQRVTKSPAAAIKARFAATEDCPWRGGVLQGQVHDDNCWCMGGYAGHAGAFANARDVLTFGAELLNGFLSPQVIAAAWMRVERPLGCDRTLGWDTPSGPDPAAGRYFSDSSVGHLGFTGTSLWIDPQAGLAVTLLTNRVHPTRENPKIKAYRPRFHNALREDIDSLRSVRRH